MTAYGEIKARKEAKGKESSSYKAVWDNQGVDMATGQIKPSKVVSAGTLLTLVLKHSMSKITLKQWKTSNWLY